MAIIEDTGADARSEAVRTRAHEAGLRYATPDELPLTRRRSGKGFVYLNGGGTPVRDPNLRQRLKRLAVPPAWTEVRLAKDPLAHIQAVGRDAEGRRQYRYHELWTESGAAVKAARLSALGGALCNVRDTAAAQLRRRTVDRDFAMGCAIALLDRAGLRVGYAEYCRETGGRGAMTLQRRHVKIADGAVTLSFFGKSGKRILRTLHDPELANALARLREAGGADLFSWGKAADEMLTADDVNAWLHAHVNDGASARDFRTFRGSAIAAGALQEADSNPARALRAAIRRAAEFLANTEAVCRSSYVHPLVQSAFQDEALDRAGLFNGPTRNGLDRGETALMRLMERAETAAPGRH